MIDVTKIEIGDEVRGRWETGPRGSSFKPRYTVVKICPNEGTRGVVWVKTRRGDYFIIGAENLFMEDKC